MQKLTKDVDLTSGLIKDHIKMIAFPAAIGFLFNTLFNVIDSLYAGRLGTEALAGLALSFPIYFLVLSISQGMGSAMSALSAIAKGKKDKETYHALIRHIFLIGIVVSAFLFVFNHEIISFLFSLTDAKGESLDLGIVYTETIMLGFVFFYINFMINGSLYALGDSKPFRNFLIIGFFLNIILNPLFMYGFLFVPAYGIKGIAYATISVQAIGTLYLSLTLFFNPYFEKTLLLRLSLKWKLYQDIFRQAIPSILNTATIAIGIFVINYFILFYGDSTHLAAYGVGIRIEQLVLIPTIGLNIAALSIIGQNYGANELDRIIETIKTSIKYGLIIMGVGMVIIFPLAPWLIGIFDDDTSVIQAGTTYLRIETIAFMSYVFINIFVAALQGIKKPGFTLILGVYRQLVPIGLFYLLGSIFNLGIYGVWIGIVFINWSAVLISYPYMRYRVNQIKK
ncbi:MAG: MATE family efflux transporter [Candidatus Izemoplasmataceae bacterium]